MLLVRRVLTRCLCTYMQPLVACRERRSVCLSLAPSWLINISPRASDVVRCVLPMGTTGRPNAHLPAGVYAWPRPRNVTPLPNKRIVIHIPKG